MMNARAIALQGIGFGALFIAVQGFTVPEQLPAHVPNPDRIISIRASERVAGIEDAGRAVFVKHEGRMMAIDDEDRSILVDPETRTLAIEDDDRVIREPSEERTTLA